LNAIERRASLLAEAEEMAAMGSWEFDLVTGGCTWSEGALRIMEVDPDREPRTAETFWRRVHPEDRDVIRADANRAVAEFRTFRFEYRANLPSGRKAEFLVQGRAVYDRAGRPLCVMGVTWDITAQKQRERDLIQREAMLTQAERMANFGTWYHDFRTDKATGSADLARIYGVHPPEDWGELLYLDRYGPADLAEALRNVERAKRECGTYDTTLRYRHTDGRLRTFHARCVGSGSHECGAAGDPPC